MSSSVNECLLDAEKSSSVLSQQHTANYRINIKTDQKPKRWWLKTLYHKYWSQYIFWIQRNYFLIFIALCFVSLFTYIAIANRMQTVVPSKDQLFQNIREKLDPAFLRLPHQEKLRPLVVEPDQYMSPDRYLARYPYSNKSTRAAFVAVVTEKDMYQLRLTMIDIERHFNHKHNYPWVILSDKVFSNRFREWISNVGRAPVSFGLIPEIEWQEPYWVDIKQEEGKAKEMSKKDIFRAESLSWRRMTRYNMGFIQHHPLLKDLEFYWKVQPGSRYHCDILQDPFERMKTAGHKFSFALTLTESHENIQSFSKVVKDFIADNKHTLVSPEDSIYNALLDDNSLQTLAHRPGKEFEGSYSNCMIWNNFMIISLDFMRSYEYNAFFDKLDASGGFFYEKWGDSLPQSFAAALFLKNKEISYDSIPGYAWRAGAVCPSDMSTFVDLKCTCARADFRISNMRFCTPKFKKAIDGIL